MKILKKVLSEIEIKKTRDKIIAGSGIVLLL